MALSSTMSTQPRRSDVVVGDGESALGRRCREAQREAPAASDTRGQVDGHQAGEDGKAKTKTEPLRQIASRILELVEFLTKNFGLLLIGNADASVDHIDPHLNAAPPHAAGRRVCQQCSIAEGQIGRLTARASA